MSRTAALSAPSAGAPLQATTIERRDLRHDDVRIDIQFAGICHSDIHQVREEWGRAQFPMVPGHEIAGVVSAVGDGVTRYKVGDRVGVGCMVDSCGQCAQCKDGHENFCEEHTVWTYNDVNLDGEPAMGGYSQQIVVSERFAVRIPDGLDLDVAAPLLCAGITVYTPLKRWGAGPGTKVAVVGMGGLGHMGVKIASAMGADVTVLSQGMSKEADGRRFGAVEYRATADGSVFKDLRGEFDLIISTISASFDVDAYLGLLRRSAPSSASACRPRRSRSASAPSPPATRCWPGPTSAASRSRRRCWTSVRSTASAPRSRRSPPSRSTTPTTASSARTCATASSSTPRPSRRADPAPGGRSSARPTHTYAACPPTGATRHTSWWGGSALLGVARLLATARAAAAAAGLGVAAFGVASRAGFGAALAAAR